VGDACIKESSFRYVFRQGPRYVMRAAAKPDREHSDSRRNGPGFHLPPEAQSRQLGKAGYRCFNFTRRPAFRLAQEHALSTLSARPARSSAKGPAFVNHPSFEKLDAQSVYGGPPMDLEETAQQNYLPDAQTGDYSRRMHYAAYRLSLAGSSEERHFWKRRYL